MLVKFKKNIILIYNKKGKIHVHGSKVKSLIVIKLKEDVSPKILNVTIHKVPLKLNAVYTLHTARGRVCIKFIILMINCNIDIIFSFFIYKLKFIN